MDSGYDSSWDLVESDEGCLPIDEDAFEKIFREWETRDWVPWLKENLVCPFPVERMEDEDDALFTDIADYEPFRLGHVMEVVSVTSRVDDRCGIMVEVREDGRRGLVPLSDCEVTSREDRNYWPVREYVVWFANR